MGSSLAGRYTKARVECLARIKSALLGCRGSVGFGFFILAMLAPWESRPSPELEFDRDEDRDTFELEARDEADMAAGLSKEYSQMEFAPQEYRL